MTYLLDTNTCIEFLRRGPGTPIALRLAAHSNEEVALCSVVVAELLYGAEKSSNPIKTRGAVDSFRSVFVSLPFDDAAADHYAQLRRQLSRSGQIIGPNDLMIAAIALAHGLTLVSHNVGEFSRVSGLVVEDWHIP